jgi:hypothetical protein
MAPSSPEQHQGVPGTRAVSLRESLGDMSGQRRKCAGDALPVLLVAYGAAGIEDAGAELLPFELGLRLRLRRLRACRRRSHDRNERQNRASHAPASKPA